MAYGKIASNITGQDGDHRSSPTCPPRAGELFYDCVVKTEEGDIFTSSLVEQLRYGKQEGGKVTSKQLLACPPKLEGSGYVIRTATSSATLVHGYHYQEACWSHSCTEANTQVKVRSSPQVWPINRKPEDLLDDNGVPQCTGI